MQAAVPRYVGQDFGDAPPGHRFRLYFAGWQPDWTLNKEKKRVALDAVRCPAPGGARLLQELRARQAATASVLADVATLDVRTLAPLVTGVGMEHPLENGFAFIDPYGLPYLPGSSVKGVVRRAAEELALFEDDNRGWSVGAVWWLFGFEATSAYLSPPPTNASEEERAEVEHWRQAYLRRVEDGDGLGRALVDHHAHALRDRHADVLQHGSQALQGSPARDRIHQAGALEFWDAYIEPRGGDMRVDIMNPHAAHYYQDDAPPSDDGHPKPLFFLTVPPGSLLTFHVRLWAPDALPSSIRGAWTSLVNHALTFAFEQCGFGAKTAVGYGRMRLDPEASLRREEGRRRREEEDRRKVEAERKAREEEARRQRLESLGPIDRLILELETCPEQRVHDIFGKELDQSTGDDRRRLAAALRDAYHRLGKWMKPSAPKQQAKVARLKSILGQQ